MRRHALTSDSLATWKSLYGLFHLLGDSASCPHVLLRAQVQIFRTRAGRTPGGAGFDPHLIRYVFRQHPTPNDCLQRDFRGSWELRLADALVNRFAPARRMPQLPAVRHAAAVHHLSLGLLRFYQAVILHPPRAMGAPGWLPSSFVTHGAVSRGDLRTAERAALPSHAGQVDAACARVWRGESRALGDARLLARAAVEEVSWARKLIVCMCLSKLRMRSADVSGAARALALAVGAYRGLVKLERQVRAKERPLAMRDYEARCEHVLRSFEPPVPPGKDPVATIARLGPRLAPVRQAQPQRTIDALDALVAAGPGLEAGDFEARVAEELARMLRARVMLHYRGGAYRVREPQRTHTLSTWALRRLIADRRLVARRVRPRPEFWRPEQHRPRGVLTVPLAAGVVVLARSRRFRPDEVRAVRTVLRFLDSRVATPSHLPVPRAAPAAGSLTVPTVAEGLVGHSAAWRVVLDHVRRAAPSGCPILLLGETGTGKERLARAIHSFSGRAQGAFVALNCGAVTPDLIASELFGHVRGAFTGAERARDGLFVQAHRGTLFLDEVADMPMPLQVALLRALEEGTVTPVGSSRPRPVDVRIVSATNADLEARVRAGSFREDLWHRLNLFVIDVPALRERIEDLPLLAMHMLARMPGQKQLHPDALEVLARYRWPGNVRELENVLRAASVLAEGLELGSGLMERLLDSRRAALGAPAASLPPRARAVLDTLSERWLSTPEIARVLGLSARTVNRELSDLVRQGLVRLAGQARAARYRRSEEAWRDSARSADRIPGPGPISTSPHWES